MRIQTINGQMTQRKSHTSFKSASVEVLNPIVAAAQTKVPLLETPIGAVVRHCRSLKPVESAQPPVVVEGNLKEFLEKKDNWIRC